MELYLCQNISRREDAYALLAYGVRRRWGLERLPDLARGEQGKPCFPAFPNCQFNLSHSGSYALCALDDRPVGVDIEQIRPHHPRLAERICSEAELRWLEEQSDREAALCKLWTRKEALVKYNGTGLTVPLREIRVPLADEGELDGLRFYCVAGQEWCACVCSHSDQFTVISVSLEEISP